MDKELITPNTTAAFGVAPEADVPILDFERVESGPTVSTSTDHMAFGNTPHAMSAAPEIAEAGVPVAEAASRPNLLIRLSRAVKYAPVTIPAALAEGGHHRAARYAIPVGGVALGVVAAKVFGGAADFNHLFAHGTNLADLATTPGTSHPREATLTSFVQPTSAGHSVDHASTVTSYVTENQGEVESAGFTYVAAQPGSEMKDGLIGTAIGLGVATASFIPPVKRLAGRLRDALPRRKKAEHHAPIAHYDRAGRKYPGTGGH